MSTALSRAWFSSPHDSQASRVTGRCAPFSVRKSPRNVNRRSPAGSPSRQAPVAGGRARSRRSSASVTGADGTVSSEVVCQSMLPFSPARAPGAGRLRVSRFRARTRSRMTILDADERHLASRDESRPVRQANDPALNDDSCELSTDAGPAARQTVPVVHDGVMRRPRTLPRRLGEAFTTRAAAAAGVGRSRRDARDLARPFHGTRARSAPSTFEEFIDSHRTIMLPAQMFVGRTAMRLWGLPHPEPWNTSEPLHVCVMPDAAPPRGAGVKGRRLAPHRVQRLIFRGAPVVDPIAAVLTSAPDLTLVQTVTEFDARLASADNYQGIHATRPIAPREEVQSRIDESTRFTF